MKRIISVLISLMLIGTTGWVSAMDIGLTQAPVINYTLSESKDTWNPITVTLDVKDNDEIVKLNYVRLSYKSQSWCPPFESGVDSSSVSYDTDIEALYLSGDENVEKLVSDACGGFEPGGIAWNYYCNALCDEDDPNKELIGPKEINGSSFTVYHNGPYIVYAEDKQGNKSFRFIEINNIKSVSFDVDVKYSSNFSDENLAEVRLNNIVENPNAPIKNIYLYKQVMSMNYAGGTDWLTTAPNTIERAQKSNLMLTPADGVYYTNYLGEYRIITEDAWGNYTLESFNIDPGGTQKPQIECVFSDENEFKVNVNVTEGEIGKIEYAETNFQELSEHREEELFFRSGKATLVKNNTFMTEPGKKYIVRALGKDGSVAYQLVIAPSEAKPANYLYEITNLSLVTQSGNQIESAPLNESFIAEVEVSKKSESDAKDYIFVAVYDKNGALLNIDYVKAKFSAGEYSFGFNIPAQNREIGSIKAFVWNSFESMTPLAEAKTINFSK